MRKANAGNWCKPRDTEHFARTLVVSCSNRAYWQIAIHMNMPLKVQLVAHGPLA